MKTIQFDIPTGMLQAVLEGRKTQLSLPLSNLNTYAVGEVLAMVEPYWDNGYGDLFYEDQFVTDFNGKQWTLYGESFIFTEGDPDKFPAYLARTFVKITGIAVKIPAEFTDEECLAEGIGEHVTIEGASAAFNYGTNDPMDFWKDFSDGEMRMMYPQWSVESLLQAIYGEERGNGLFYSEMVVLTFERCTREGGAE